MRRPNVENNRHVIEGLRVMLDLARKGAGCAPVPGRTAEDLQASDQLLADLIETISDDEAPEVIALLAGFTGGLLLTHLGSMDAVERALFAALERET